MPLIVIGLIVINVLVYIFPFLVSFTGPYGSSFLNFMSLGWKENTAIADGEYYRLITSGFLHGDFTHLFLNMYSLWNVSNVIFALNAYNPLQFAVIYMVSLISGSTFSFWFNANPSVGASGAIFGLVGSLVPFAIERGNTGLLSSLMINIGILAVFGFLAPRIDNWGHFGGFIGGLIVGYFYLRFAQ